jgi:uncharacterized protein with von Willebrand factor type A (vWA) domain
VLVPGVAAVLAGQTLRSGVDVVTVPVSVTNRPGTESIRNLSAEQFRVFEEGVEQTITTFSTERRPVSLCITLDSSGSMEGPRQQLAIVAVTRLIAGLAPDDEVAIVTFAHNVEVPVR